jgi:hypothetical protein
VGAQPGEAYLPLATSERGDIMVIPPTMRTLDDLAGFASVDAVLDGPPRRVVRAVRPEVVATDDLPTLGYPANTGRPERPPRRLVLARRPLAPGLSRAAGATTAAWLAVTERIRTRRGRIEDTCLAGLS